MADEGFIELSNTVVDRQSLEKKIGDGEYLIIAGDESAIASLPSGNWISGTIPYFMTENGGKTDQENIYVTTIKGVTSNNRPSLTLYDMNTIPRIAKEAPDHGVTVLILPANSDVHLSYAKNAPDYENMFFSPIMGWVSGVHLNELGQQTAKIGFGPASGMMSDKHAVAIHIPLPEGQTAEVKTVNLFTQGNGPSFSFSEKGFSVEQCLVDGRQTRFSDYIKEQRIDTRLPLVANYSGVMVNVSIQEVLDEKVNLYAPVFPGVTYHFASPVDDYVAAFNNALLQNNANGAQFSCNCILNYLYSELEGKQTGVLTGPMTFGEIAYQLVNQTLVYLTIERL